MLDAVDRAGGIELTNDWIRPEEVVSVVHKCSAARTAELTLYGLTRCVQMFWKSTDPVGLSEPEKLSVPAANTFAPDRRLVVAHLPADRRPA